MRILLIALFLAGCASDGKNYSERVYTTQIVTGWMDANGHVHLKGVGGADGYASVNGK